jgi:phage terminase small subunit
MKNKLTNRHQKFCDEYLANGMNGTRAYLSVYTNVKKDETAMVNASRLLSTAKVSEYVKSKQKEQSEKSLMSYEELVNKFIWVVNNSEEEGIPTKAGKITDRSSMISALKEVGKLLSHYPADKIDHTTKGESMNPPEITYKD